MAADHPRRTGGKEQEPVPAGAPWLRTIRDDQSVGGGCHKPLQYKAAVAQAALRHGGNAEGFRPADIIDDESPLQPPPTGGGRKKMSIKIVLCLHCLHLHIII